MPENPNQRWIQGLEEEDLAFLKRFVLASGSLKDLAAVYDVSYPTVRLRLDRLIQKVRILDDVRTDDPFERLLRAQFGDGKLDAATFKQLFGAYQNQKNGSPS
ncbi:MAG: DUF2089 family protein [Verrucomicrobiales bacterium]|nr:DUF2089 family protein [Verrucomicrobiales bacterium]